MQLKTSASGELPPRSCPIARLSIAATAALALTVLATAALPARAGTETRHTPIVREFPDNLFGVALGARGQAVATGYHSTIRVSSDGGASWSRLDLGGDELLRRATLLDDGRVFAVSSGGKILRLQPGEDAWRVVHEEPGLYLRDIAFATGQTGWAVGHDGLILHTADGGTSWQPQALKDLPGRDKPRLSGIAAIDATHAVLVGEFGVVAQTLDGGANWTIVSANSLPTLLAVAMRGAQGFAVGLNGALVALSLPGNGPARADLIQTGVTQHFYTVALSPDGRTAVIGGNGLLASYSDGKLADLPVPQTAALTYAFIGGVAIRDDGHTVAVGKRGLILRAAAPQGPYELANSSPSVGSSAPPSDTPVTQ